MYGGAFATVPAYLADMFGTQFVGAIHGRLLTAWSTAGVIGPVLVSYMREAAISAGVPRSSVYDVTLYLLAGLPAPSPTARSAAMTRPPALTPARAATPSPAATRSPAAMRSPEPTADVKDRGPAAA